MEREFLARSYRTTLALLAVVALFTFVYLGPRAALGVAAGAVLGVLNLRLIEELVVHWLRPQGARVGRVALAALLKLALVYGAGYLLLARGWVDPLAAAAGFPMILAVIFLKALGRMYVARAGVEPPAPSATRGQGKEPR
ncbi:MAG: hypothetical protein HZB25_13475 [Candidatus Eisenbacteria bacterium]|nr:hypothetical protein [Candidatus Eisenbacteria bacterium]